MPPSSPKASWTLTLKARVWLLGLIVLLSVAAVLGLHLEATQARLTQHHRLLDLLGQTRHLSLAVHELQRERGLSTRYLMHPEDALLTQLRAQQAATDLALAAPGASVPPPTTPLQPLEERRRHVLTRRVSAQEVLTDYGERIAPMLDVLDELSLAAGSHPLHRGMVAHSHLVRAKEGLGRLRGLIAALPSDPTRSALWLESLGDARGRLRWHLDRFVVFSGPGDVELARTVSDGEELRRALRLLSTLALDGSAANDGQTARQRHEVLTVAIDALRTHELQSLAALQARAEADRARTLWRAGLETLGLLLVAGALAHLALSSLQRLLKALEGALRGVQRVVRARKHSPAPVAPLPRDETKVLAQSYGALLDLVDQLAQTATLDALTGALNRHGFSELAPAELAQARRHERALSLIMMDLDHFKQVNDTYGHATGDVVLQTVATVVKRNLREADVFARWGGEEFVILAPDTSAPDAERLAERLRLLLRRDHGAGVPHFTVSFGVTELTSEDDLDSLFARADGALYEAKQTGRDRVVRR